MKLEDKYKELCLAKYPNPGCDISEHLPTLRNYAEQCESVTEMGVRWTASSSIAFAAAKPKSLICIDIEDCSQAFTPYLNEIKENGTNFKFVLGNTLQIDIEPVDLLFIDTYHIYNQLVAELALHSKNAKKWIIFHDTESFGEIGENPDFKGLKPAINEFLNQNNCFEFEKSYYNNNGITIIKRIKENSTKVYF